MHIIKIYLLTPGNINRGLKIKNMRKLLLTLTAILSFLVTVTAQSHIVTGKVTDSLGNPLPSASIRVKGAKSGTAADANGNFSISVPSGATLVFTGIGIISQE
ncbi:MAG: SusC/RagA family TonB-linked outer membrane protein, partial [Chitinophagaceae bacterium]|nr:SusC/RagA family TonB-linked outer membrane protein [Chitinophagaceae bacterium]